MGCSYSTALRAPLVSSMGHQNCSVAKQRPVPKGCCWETGRRETKPSLTDDQVELVRESWRKLHADIAGVGIVMFTRLFETHPDVQDAFMDFRNKPIENIRHSKSLREHGLRVMTTVEKVLARIDDRDKLNGFIQNLGAKHVTYKADINYIRLVGPQFVSSIKSELAPLWTEETEAAWYRLFDYITFFMEQGMVSTDT